MNPAKLLQSAHEHHLAGRLRESESVCEQILKEHPKNAPALHLLGALKLTRGERKEAVQILRQAVEANPASAEAWIMLGNALLGLNELDEASQALERATKLRPDLIDNQVNLGNVFKARSQLDSALECYRKVIEVDPCHYEANSAYLYTLHYHPKYSPADILREHQEWDERYCRHLTDDAKPHSNNRDPNRKLRIGYVSPDFRSHTSAFFYLPLFARHDHENFEYYFYSDVRSPDQVTEKIRPLADVWKDTSKLSDFALSELIRKDQIDVLIDPTLHMADNRLRCFARKPAPVQITWLGYPSTTGLSAMDYRITDPFLDPPGISDANYVEKSIRLRNTFWCYDPLTTEVEVGPLPARSNGHITFGCLNNFCKVNDPTMEIWAAAMKLVHGSRLILMAPKSEQPRVLSKFGSLGIESSRIEFADFQPRIKYLETYHRIDVGLDTFPYNGHTTSLDAYYMGVPVVTIIGQTAVGRGGWSQLSNLQLQFLAGEDRPTFLGIVAKLCSDIPMLTHLRATMRERFTRSPLTDANAYARNMEAVYRNAWQIWCDNKE
jgi:predicted O-linked N-acetylglucosamine transferase (SPINDLY family)